MPSSLRVLVVCSDLLFRAKIRDAIRASGHEPLVPGPGGTLPAELDDAIVDLGDTRLDPLASIAAVRAMHPGARVIGFASHVRADLLDAGRQAGCDAVVPRSRAVRAVEALLRGERPDEPADDGD